MSGKDPVDNLIDDIEKEFEKVDIPLMEKLTLFAKVQNALYKCAELCEDCKDCVSREAVVKAIDKHTFDTADGLCLDDDITCILEELPLVQTKHLHGHWIKNGEIFKCSNCGELSCCEGNYCPDCGVKMKKE